MISVADYIFKYLADYGIKHVFLVVGGGAMFLNDALRKEIHIKYICNHHEQASALAAEGYSRVSGELSVVNVTSGPGGTNALTGILCQWTDSIPVLYLSGQVKFETTITSNSNINLRQLGDQEINIIDIVKSITKYAKMIIDPYSIKAELDKAIFTATSGRPGPVWLDIPLNVQNSLINEQKLKGWSKNFNLKKDLNKISKVINFICAAKRPLIIAGHGIRIAKAKDDFLHLVNLFNIPVVTTFNGFDLLPTDSNNFIGRIGTLGTRAGNFALQNSDLIICLGTRNNIRQISYNWEFFAPKAKKIIVDIDKAELHKKTIKGDILINLNVKDFISNLINNFPDNYISNSSWLEWCRTRKKKYPIVLNEYKQIDNKYINPYYFIDRLTNKLNKNIIVVASNGTACVTLFQAGIVKENQRIFWNSGGATMGYGLPAAIGASLFEDKEVICITGDGSLQMNIQELQTIKYYNLPIKILILNNGGYHSIIQTQNNYFKGNLIGCDKSSGISFPEISKLAEIYGFKYFKIDSIKNIDNQIENILLHKGKLLCEVMLSNDYTFMPKLSSKKNKEGIMVSQPLENLYPFLNKKELKSNMIEEYDYVK